MNRHRRTKKPTGKEARTINFDVDVLKALDDKANKDESNVSLIVNAYMRQVILSDEIYYRMKAKEAYLEFQKYKYLADQEEARKETKLQD